MATDPEQEVAIADLTHRCINDVWRVISKDDLKLVVAHDSFSLSKAASVTGFTSREQAWISWTR